MKPKLPWKNKDIERREKYITIHLKNRDTKRPQLNTSNAPYTSWPMDYNSGKQSWFKIWENCIIVTIDVERPLDEV